MPHLLPSIGRAYLRGPAHNIGVKCGNGHNDDRSHVNYLAWCDQWFEACARVLKPEGSIYLMHYPEVCAE